MRRLRVVILVVAVCAVAVVAVILVAGGGEKPSPPAQVAPRDKAEQALRRYLTEPGPGQIAPGGTKPRRIACRRRPTGWRCTANYPQHIRVTCFITDKFRGALPVNPICE